MSDDNDDDDDDLVEVYVYRGGEAEEVPFSVEKLIVEEGVQELRDWLCNKYDCLQEVTLPNNGFTKIGIEAFNCCDSLLEISIRNTVQSIGEGAFGFCDELKKVSFECSPSSPHQHQLQTLGNHAFSYCSSLLRIKLPSSVNAFGEKAFVQCYGLKEANLSTTGVTEISTEAFSSCYSLQTVSLPNTLERIGECAFAHCSELVTVIVPLDGSKSIRIGKKSFADCRRLANLQLPKDSTAEENSFVECELLHKHYGEDASRILAGLMGRFEDLPIHRMCYDHSAINDVQEFLQFIGDHQEEGSLVDEIGMTPFHVLFSTIEPRVELLEALLESPLLPYVAKRKDANGRQPLDYLISNWTDGSSSLLQMTLQKSIIDRLTRWGTKAWMEDIQSKVQAILGEDLRQRCVEISLEVKV